MFSIHSANCKLNSKPLLQLKGRASQSEGGGEPAADHGWGAFWKRSLSQLGTGSWGLLPTGTLRPALSLSPGDKGIGARRSRSGPLAFFPTCHEQGPACCHSPEAAGGSRDNVAIVRVTQTRPGGRWEGCGVAGAPAIGAPSAPRARSRSTGWTPTSTPPHPGLEDQSSSGLMMEQRSGRERER